MEKWEALFRSEVARVATPDDPAHDLSHIERVVKMAKFLCANEGGRIEVVVPSAWLHDFVIIPKNDPRRSQASRLSAEAAIQFLQSIQYPEIYFADVLHAIESHSFSAGIAPRTLEARIVQDADRLDGLGAIGIARCFATAGLLRREFYSAIDPFCDSREPDDQTYTVDHFYRKLFRVAETLQTEAGQTEGRRRVQVMQTYLTDLRREIQD